jgi:glycosyltransferase involved in cell wall biosynthesis
MSIDVTIDVFEFFPSSQQGYGTENYDSVATAKGYFLPFRRGKTLFDSIVRGKSLHTYLNNKYFDVIHCHWIVSPVVLQKSIKKHCKKLFISFWGGELLEQKILYSNTIYRHYLNRFIKQADCIVNDKEGKDVTLRQFPFFKGEYKAASYGSAPLEALYNLMQSEDKNSSKTVLGISTEKLTVLIGYSGKELHRHIPIIATLAQHNELKQRLHLLAPMTRDAREDYIKDVKNALDNSGYSYSLISGRFLSNKEVAQIRNATDIVLQLSIFDGFSRSIIECLCAKSVVIYGDWLGYEQYMKSSGFEGIEVPSIEYGVNMLAKVLNDPSSYKTLLEKNHEYGRHQAIWSECIKDWVNAYNDILE